ncbi:MAG: DNA recombination protein RmuC [Clostridiales Family XIII bacterium]|jgi:DNA recombination protein RmuC|nr:DNA recombination protein RmuC [Clostridiales Family XIII bacterium]
MNNLSIIILIVAIVLLIVLVVALALIISLRGRLSQGSSGIKDETVGAVRSEFALIRSEMSDGNKALREELGQNSLDLRRELGENVAELRGELTKNIGDFRTETAKGNSDFRAEISKKLEIQAAHNEEKLEGIRSTMEKRITSMQDDNSKQLDRMRETVDEKLQKTLEDRIGQSFKMVSERLEQVYKGLGEMQTLATGVGDLKKVLSNVKTRGILGEIQLGAILEEILPKEQYEENIATVKGSTERVEFAIRLPGDGEEPVYLPIDAKFPGDAYSGLVEAYEEGDIIKIEASRKQLVTAIKLAAKDISTKYIGPPDTTDFAIMFLPFEGLYAEVLQLGMVEVLQRDYKINIAGPTTMAALLNSLQMGFRTLAIQKRSGEVWKVLGAVKKEFDNFQGVLESARKRLDMAQSDLDKLMTTRTNKIRSKLRDVTSLTESETEEILGTGTLLTVEDDPIEDE